MLVAARDAGVKRMVYAGSSSVVRRHADAAEDRRRCRPSRSRPTRCRSSSAEQYGQMFTRLYGLETVTIRYFNVFGPRQDPWSPYSGVISLFISALRDGTPADHLRRRRANARLHLRRQRRRRRSARCRDAGCGGEVINVATGGRISLNQLLATLKKHLRLERRADLQGSARRRRAGFAGGHLEGAAAARLQAGRRPRRRPAPHGRLVQSQ